MIAGLAEIAAIEMGMLDRLRATAVSFGVGWASLTTYPDDWDSFLEASVNFKTPGAFVVFSGWNSTDEMSDDTLVVRDASFALVVAYENLRKDAQAQRHGGPDPLSEPGSYRLIMAALSALAGQSVGVDLVSPLKAGPGRHVARSEQDMKRGLSRYSILFTCDFSMSLVADGETDPAELQALHANWDIPALGDPIPIDADAVAEGVQLPDDAHADATDHLPLGDD